MTTDPGDTDPDDTGSARSERAMVATPHPRASEAARDALQEGGSAVDAAIAAHAVLSVAYPHMSGLGGDGFWLVAPTEGDVRAINASGPAASDATREFYAMRGHEAVPERGPGAALTVPGAVDGWRLAHEAHGDLPWDRLFAEAIECARDGVAVTAKLAGWILHDRDVLEADPEASDVFLPCGTVPEPGERLVQSDLAATLTKVATAGPRDGFYEGPVARLLPAGLPDDASPLASEDFERYRAEWVDPVSVPYRGYTAYAVPPNTQGITALQLLGILEGFDVGAWGEGTAAYYHHLVEATKVAFADRNAWVADPDWVAVPVEALLDADYLATRRNLIDADEARDGIPDPGISPPATGGGTGPGGDTCYLCVVDENGLAVSTIQSIYHDFGSGIVAGDTGIVPQNRGASFSLSPDHVNALEPGKRPFHTLIPGLLTRDGEARLLYGTMGGEGQPQTQAALVTRLLDYGFDVQSAIDAPRWLFGRTWGGERTRSLSVEGRVDDDTVTTLRSRGHDVSVVDDYDPLMGHAQAIAIDPDGGLEGGADSRGDGTAIGL